MYACTTCGRLVPVRLLRPTASAQYMRGYCLTCATERFFSEGESRKESGMRLAETAEAIAGPWVEKADMAIDELAASGREFSAEDVAEIAGRPSHPNAMGARIHAAARRGVIEKVGVVKASRPERHANEMRMWKGADGVRQRV